MCGIIGVSSSSVQVDRTWLVAARDTLAHRGPDDAGIWWSDDGRTGLGHRRLAIIDLSAAGHQPMRDPSGELTIVFNGEIYNFRDLRADLMARGHTFRSTSDTEVILAAYREWGIECLGKLNGMFAFALHDSGQQTVLLARDRSGEKPLFYFLRDQTLYFASELKGLIGDHLGSRGIDPDALDLYLAIGYVPGGRSLVKGANKLPAAHALLFDTRRGISKLWRYWNLPANSSLDTSSDADDEALLSEFESLLEGSVRQQLVADVPVGVLLSGGVDSSLITAMAVRASTRVKTFTVGFSDFPQFDESRHARLISNYFGTEHTELRADHISPEVLTILARQFDEPIVDSSMIPTHLVSRLVRQHCTVALGGDGGDELFGGYSHYTRLLWTKEKVGWIPSALRKGTAYAAKTFLPTGFRGRNWLQALDTNWESGLPLIAAYFDPGERSRLMRGGARDPWRPIAEQLWRERVPVVADLIERATRADFNSYMTDDILVKVDRASMLNSLELRAPLLDYRIIEFAFGRTPTRLKTSGRGRKILLKRLAARLFPPEFDRQRKQGFSIPLGEWLKQGVWKAFFFEVLTDSQCLFNKKATTALLNGQERGRRNEERLFGLVLFELWRRQYRMAI